MPTEITIIKSINEAQKNEVARMYYQAFLKKFSYLWLFVKDEEKGIEILQESINFEDGLYAVHNGKVLGFVGLEKGKRFYTHLRFSTLSKSLNMGAAAWRYLAYGIYRLFHGQTRSDTVHIDPIAVSSESRGMGIGTKLLEAAFEYAKLSHRRKVILEVVDTNPQAKKLYEKMGFKVVRVENTALLTKHSGFRKVLHMEKVLN